MIKRFGLAAAGLLAAIGPALAHHPMGGVMPTTLLEGFLSGIGHPVIGVDHLAFIVAIGIAVAFTTGGVGILAGFIAASTVGVIAHVVELNVPLVEPLVAASVIVAGAALAAGWAAVRPGWLALAVVAGVLHGYAFGEAVVGGERSVIGAYLIGLALVQIVIAGIAMAVARMLLMHVGGASAPVRATGGILAVVGVALLILGLVEA